MRFVLGMLSGLVTVVGAALVLSVLFPLPSDTPPPDGLGAPPEALAKEAQVEAVTPVAPDAVAQARAAYNPEVARAIDPDATAPQVSDQEALRSAQLADALRAATGDLPDLTSAGSGALINFAQVNDRRHPVMPAYYAVWQDLLQRCFTTIVQQEPMDETGLTPKGDEVIDYAQPHTEQTWFSADKAFKLKISTRSGDTNSGVLRSCSLQSNRFALADSASVLRLKPEFHTWWASAGHDRRTTLLDYPYTLAKQHKWYGGLTEFGSYQGCEIKVEFSEITLGGETDASLFFTETGRNGCQARYLKARGGAVRVNRLPQASN